MTDLVMTRGSRKTIHLSNLVDADGNPTVFGASDVLHWTAKGYLAQPYAEAFLRKTSADGGITFVNGGNSGDIHISATDWTGLQLPADSTFVWDLKLYPSGVAAQACTLASGTGTIDADVTDNPIVDVVDLPGLHGPCTEWVTLAECLADPRCVTADGSRLDPAIVQRKIAVASEILYRLTARLYAGVCADTVRPTTRWYRSNYGLPRQWQIWPRDIGGITNRNPHRWEGFGPTSEISLGAYPIREVSEVRINGTVYNPAFYRVDDQRWLVNLDPSGVGWPTGQDFTLDSLTDPNTWQVTFTWGQAPPIGGVEACKEYAIELAKGATGDPCNLPERVQSLQMQGVSYTLLDPMSFLDEGKTGLYAVDAWVVSINPNRLRRRSGIHSPDFPRPVRRTGVLPGS